MTISIREIFANGLSFRCREAGPAGGEPVLLLHGFPETSHQWVELLPALAAEGYHCLAPDQRGYSPGARPEGKEHYATDLLARDAVALADAAGFGPKFHLIGHDWGAGVGWRVVANHAERVKSWTSLSIPHPASYGAAFANDPDQQQRSQYIIMFQEPGVAEAALSADNYAALRGVWSASPPEEVAEYLSVFTQPGALTAALNWYRAAFGGGDIGGDNTFRVATPTLLIWGNQDQAVGRSTTLHTHEYMDGPYRFLELDAGHWLVQEKFEVCRDEILKQLAASCWTKD